MIKNNTTVTVFHVSVKTEFSHSYDSVISILHIRMDGIVNLGTWLEFVS